MLIKHKLYYFGQHSSVTAPMLLHMRRASKVAEETHQHNILKQHSQACRIFIAIGGIPGYATLSKKHNT